MIIVFCDYWLLMYYFTDCMMMWLQLSWVANEIVFIFTLTYSFLKIAIQIYF